MGQPSPEQSGLARFESIEARQLTWGSDTSQYPQEKESIEIPRVEAIEMGTA